MTESSVTTTAANRTDSDRTPSSDETTTGESNERTKAEWREHSFPGDLVLSVEDLNVWYGTITHQRYLDRHSKRALRRSSAPPGCGNPRSFGVSTNERSDQSSYRGRCHPQRAEHLRRWGQPRRTAEAHRHGVPAPEPVPKVDSRERRLRPAKTRRRHRSRVGPPVTRTRRQGQRRRVGRAVPSRRCPGTRSKTALTTTRWDSPARSNSGCASPDVSPLIPKSF